MTIKRSAKLYRYCLPMDSGVIVRENRLSQREGYIIELQQAGKVALGECAPLPSFSVESLAEVEAQLIQAIKDWVNNGNWPVWSALAPSVASGLSFAKLELEEQLPIQGNYQVAPLCTGDPDELLPVFEQMEAQGRQPLAKVKVGLYEPIRDGILVNLFFESIPKLKLRLDANRSWSLDRALKFASYITPEYRERIEFIEEPCATPEESLKFAEQTAIRIAWDETIQQKVYPCEHEIYRDSKVGAYVIKPSLVGSMEQIQAWVTLAEASDKKIIISSSIESSIGLTQLARLATLISPEQIPGLDTLQLFQHQLEREWPNSTLPRLRLSEQVLIQQWSNDR